MDAASETIAKLNDTSQYSCRKAVPLFRPHTRVVGQGKSARKIVVTDDDLGVIAANAQSLEQSGTLVRFVDGHLKPGADQSQQPRLLGYVKNLRVGTFGPRSIRCILGDVYVKADSLDYVNNRPFRSAEYYPETKEIRGVAALISDPALNLGVVNYEDDPEMMGMSDEDKAKAMQFAKYMVSQGWIPDWEKMPEESPPGDDETMKKKDEDKVDNAAEVAPALYAAQKEALALKARIEVLEREKDLAKCQTMVDNLVAENYQLDPTVEVKRLAAMEPQDRKSHVDYVRRHYARSADGFGLAVYQGSTGGDPPEPSREEVDKAVRLATKQSLDFDTALDKIRKGAK